MDGQVRLVVEAREDVRIETAEMARGEAAVVAEALRRLGGGFVICQFGGLVVPDEATSSRSLRPRMPAVSWCGSGNGRSRRAAAMAR